ncbi:MAG: glycosyltransferase [Candidatus Binatia bacterium]
MTQATVRIGYVLKVFPRVSETFVINEIHALERLGQPLCVFSLHRAGELVAHRILTELRSPLFCVEQTESASEHEILSARRRLERRLGVAAAYRARFLPRHYVRLALVLATLTRQHGVRHLHAHFASRAGHVAALAACLSGCSYSITAHAKDIYHSSVDPDVLRFKLAGARFVSTVSEYNRRYLHELLAGIPGAAQKIVRVYNGVDLGRFRACPVPARDPALVLSVGRLVEKKGLALLVDACRTLRSRGYGFCCELVGAGPEEAALRARIAAAGLQGRVRLAGVLTTEQVAARLQAATVVALPCIVAQDGNVDALPTVLLEAMATGRAVVSTRLSGIPEIVVDGETGLLVPPGDAGALADALAELLSNPQRAAAMGQAGRRRAERLFDLHTNTAVIRALLLGRPGGAAGQ